jgi:glycolate oxidase
MASVVLDSKQQLLAEFAAIVGADHVLVGPELTDQFVSDMQPLAVAGKPLAVVRPASTDEVAGIVRTCAREGIPVVARGAGSGMTGAGNAIDGGVSIVLTRMNRILEVDETARVAVVEPGLITLDLKRAVEEKGLFYAPDPTSSDWCTIGGNLANGSAGPCGSKYGTTADAVLALEVVMASGEVLHTGRRTLKGVSGYDLNRLFVGSEGTLGIITQATLALRAKPCPPATCVAAFKDVQAAVDAVTGFLTRGGNLSLLEFMDRPCVAAVEESLGASLLDGSGTPAAVLFGQSDAGRGDDLDAFEASCLENGAHFTYQTADTAEGEMLMQYWHGLEAALEAKGQWILHEVTTPRDKMAGLVAAVARISESTGIWIGVHGHAADGTVHPMIVMDPTEPRAMTRARDAYDQIIQAARSLGGTVTGEHGVGRMKKTQLAEELGDVGLSVHRAIKQALDPFQLMNPGVMFDAPNFRSNP